MDNEKLALFGGNRAVRDDTPVDSLFAWPDITPEVESAALGVIRSNSMSETSITIEFEKKFAEWQQRKYGVAFNNGTLSLEAAMFAVGLGEGDEIICPSKTYWASCTGAMRLGASVVFANVDPATMCIDPNDLERCVGPDTKAIMVVHYFGHPADMDPICAFARKHGLKLIEDVSHAQGGRYKGKMLGTFGDAAAMSLMSGKSFACGELGMLVTDDREVYERAIAYSHYERNNENYIKETEYLKKYYHMPLGGMKGRVNQVCSAIGLVRLKEYDEKTAVIRRAMNYFLDRLEGVKGFRAIRVDESDGSTMAGWYCPHALYVSSELGGLLIDRYLEAVNAEIAPSGIKCWPGGNFPLHTHPMFKDFDLTHSGKPTRIRFAARDVRELDKALRPTEQIECFSIPWFKRWLPEDIAQYADAFRKVSEHYKELLDERAGADGGSGRWYGGENR